MSISNPLASFRKRSIGAGKWVFSSHALSQVMRLSSNLILTRLLVPEMFAVMSISMLFIMAITMLSDVGIRQYIVRFEGPLDQKTLNSAWVVQIIKGIVVGIFLAIISAGIYFLGEIDFFSSDTVYAHRALPFVLAALSLTPVISGFSSTKLHVLNRDLRLGYIVILETVTQLLGISVMILIAWNIQTIWALVAGTLIGSVLKTLASHYFLPGMNNRFDWDRTELKKIYHFGKWIFVSSIFGFFVNNADRIWLGGLITPEKLGVFTIASMLAIAAVEMVRKLYALVLLPALSAVSRDEREYLSVAYYKARLVIDSFMMLLAGFLYQGGIAIVDLLYDDRYIEAGNILSVLSISLVSSILLQGDKCLVALGHVKVRTAIVATNAVVLNVAIPVSFIYFDLSGALLAIVISPFVSVSYLFYELKKLSILNLTNEFRCLPLFILGGIIGYFFSEIIEIL